MKYHLLDKSGATYVDVHLHRPVSGVAILKPNLSLGFLLAIWTRWPNNNVNEKVAKNVKSQVDQVSLEPFLSAAKRLQVSIVVSGKTKSSSNQSLGLSVLLSSLTLRVRATHFNFT